MKKLLAGAVSITAFLALAVPAGAASNDPYFSKQWGLQKIQAEQAWATSTGSGVLVAVVDSGVDLTHPDLAANIVSNADADFVDPNGRDGAQDENGHGTHVAGIIGAVANNGTGIAGVAPGAKILPVRVLDAEGNGTTDDVAAGIKYAADKGAKVINLSVGIDPRGHAVKLIGALDPIYEAIDHAVSKGAVLSIAAGNDSFPLCGEPAANPGVVCVGATDKRDLISWYSNYDAPEIHPNYLVAPGGSSAASFALDPSSPLCGEDIFSTYLRTATTFCSGQEGYEAIAGTSMAAPHVSGVAALLAAKGLSNTQIVSCLKSSADDLGVPGRDPLFGYGRVNALKAVTSC